MQNCTMGPRALSKEGREARVGLIVWELKERSEDLMRSASDRKAWKGKRLWTENKQGLEM